MRAPGSPQSVLAQGFWIESPDGLTPNAERESRTGAFVTRAPSVLGRLLQELSWEGNARHYRGGGRGFENVLTAEVFQALDFLPRSYFLGPVLAGAVGAERSVKALASEAEDASFSFLPGDTALAKKPALAVQPDVVIESSSTYCLVEAKRLGSARFQPEQLAREYVAAIQEAAKPRAGHGRQPLLLLVLPKKPPVLVSRRGALEISDAIELHLERVVSRCDQSFPPVTELVDRITSVVAFTTWSAIADVIRTARDDFPHSCGSMLASVTRLSNTALTAIEWHQKSVKTPAG
jgi:hypothetical protein